MFYAFFNIFTLHVIQLSHKWEQTNKNTKIYWLTNEVWGLIIIVLQKMVQWKTESVKNIGWFVKNKSFYIYFFVIKRHFTYDIELHWPFK